MVFKTKNFLPFKTDPVFQILAFAVFFVPLAVFADSYDEYDALKVALLAAAVAVAVCIRLYKKQILSLNKFFTAALATFVFWALVVSIPSGNKLYAFFGAEQRYLGLIFFILLAIFSIYLLSRIRNDRSKSIFLIKLISVSGLLISLFGIIQSYGYAYYQSVDTIGSLLRPPSFLGNADVSAMFLSAVLPLTLLVFLKHAETFKQKVFWFVTIFFEIWGLIMFASRGALLAAAIGLILLLFFALFKKNKKEIFAIVSCLLIAGALTAAFIPISRSDTVASSESDSARIMVWKDSLESIIKHPVFGVGLGQVAVSVGESSGYFDDAHNFYLQTGMTGGIPFLLILLVLDIYPIIVSLRHWRKSGFKDSFPEYLAIAELILLVAASFSPVTAVCWLLLAILVVLQISEIAQEREWFSVCAPIWLMAVPAAFFAVYALALASSSIFLYKALAFQQEASYNYLKIADYENLSYQLYPAEFISRYSYLQTMVNASGQPVSVLQNEIQNYAQVYKNTPNTPEYLSDLYQSLFQRTENVDYEKTAIIYAQQEYDFIPSLSNSVLLATDYENLGEYKQARQTAVSEIGLLNSTQSQQLWLLLSEIDAKEGYGSKTVIADLQKAYLADVSSDQLKHLLQKSKTNPEIAMQYALSIHLDMQTQ